MLKRVELLITITYIYVITYVGQSLYCVTDLVLVLKHLIFYISAMFMKSK